MTSTAESVMSSPMDDHSKLVLKLALEWFSDPNNTGGTLISPDIHILDTISRFHKCKDSSCVVDNYSIYKYLYPIYKKDKTSIIMQIMDAMNKQNGTVWNGYQSYLTSLLYAHKCINASVNQRDL